MGTAFLKPLNQLQMTDFEEIRSYRAPPESVVQVTNAVCMLFHRERGWSSAKQLLCSEDFYQVGREEGKEKRGEEERVDVIGLDSPDKGQSIFVFPGLS